MFGAHWPTATGDREAAPSSSFTAALQAEAANLAHRRSAGMRNCATGSSRYLPIDRAGSPRSLAIHQDSVAYLPSTVALPQRHYRARTRLDAAMSITVTPPRSGGVGELAAPGSSIEQVHLGPPARCRSGTPAATSPTICASAPRRRVVTAITHRLGQPRPSRTPASAGRTWARGGVPCSFGGKTPRVLGSLLAVLRWPAPRDRLPDRLVGEGPVIRDHLVADIDTTGL